MTPSFLGRVVGVLAVAAFAFIGGGVSVASTATSATSATDPVAAKIKQIEHKGFIFLDTGDLLRVRNIIAMGRAAVPDVIAEAKYSILDEKRAERQLEAVPATSSRERSEREAFIHTVSVGIEGQMEAIAGVRALQRGSIGVSAREMRASNATNDKAYAMLRNPPPPSTPPTGVTSAPPPVSGTGPASTPVGSPAAVPLHVAALQRRTGAEFSAEVARHHSAIYRPAEHSPTVPYLALLVLALASASALATVAPARRHAASARAMTHR